MRGDDATRTGSHTPGTEAGRTNQLRDEPLPASPEEESGQLATRRNEELGELGASSGLPGPGDTPVGPGTPTPPAPLTGAVPASEAPQNAPGVLAGSGNPDDGADAPLVRDVANAVQGKPDGEVDTRSDQPATGTDTIY